MFRTFLATTALAALLAGGAASQQAPGAVERDGPLLRPGTGAPTGGADAPAVTEEPAEDDAEALAEDDAPGTAPLAGDDPADAPPLAGDDPADDPAPAAAEDAPAPGAVPEAGVAADADADADPADEALVADEAPPDEAPGLAADGAAGLDLAGATPEELAGSGVLGIDGEEIATVDDVLTEPGGDVETILVRFGGFLGFGQTVVALAPEEVEVERGEDETLALRTTLSADDLRERPAHEAN